MTTGRFTFRRLTDDDLPMLHAWLNEPGVVRWWEGDDVSWDGVVRDYGSASDETTEHWIASLDGLDVAWLGCYATRDEPEEARPWWASTVTPRGSTTSSVNRRSGAEGSARR